MPGLEKAGARHGFFSRIGGVSDGIFASLNTGPGSSDDPAHVTENRARCAGAIGIAPERLLSNYQIHSADVVVVDGPWDGAQPEADAFVSKTRGLGLGILTADCMPWLFCDPSTGIIGAAHAGWRGALGGVLENTVESMEKLGAKRENICAAVGPCLRQENFEVGLDLVEAFTDKYRTAISFFSPGISSEKRQFDLVSFAKGRLREVGVTLIEDTNICTLGESETYFSYRGTRQRGERDYGRNLSVIALL